MRAGGGWLEPRQAFEGGAEEIGEGRLGELLAGLGDGALGDALLVAEVDEGGAEVVVEAGRRRGGGGGEGERELPHPVAQLDDHPLGGLPADAGDRGQAADVAGVAVHYNPDHAEDWAKAVQNIMDGITRRIDENE